MLLDAEEKAYSTSLNPCGPGLKIVPRPGAETTAIAVPTITLEGDANGAPHPDPVAYAKKFTGKYEHRLISGGIGHNLPQEAPQEFAKAIIDADKF